MINTQCLLNMLNNSRYQSVVSKHGNPSWNKKSSKKKNSKNNSQNIDGLKAIVDDVYDDVKNDTQSAIHQWYNKTVITNDKLKNISNKLIQKSIEVVMNNKH